jgi:hypothetical protein
MTRLLPRFLSFLCLNAALCWGGACDLAGIAGDIDRGNLAAAETRLKAVEAAGQRCDELLLQAGRLKFAQADFTGTEDLFSDLSTLPRKMRVLSDCARGIGQGGLPKSRQLVIAGTFLPA